MVHASSNGPGTGVCRLGTRGSDLALWQARTIAGMLHERGVATEIVIITTTGDAIDNVPFSKLEGKGFFTKELEDAQLEGRVDFAVHSLKDLATEMPAGLQLVAMVGREDPREMLLARPEAVDLERQERGEVLPLVAGATLGTSAARRQAQVRGLRPDLEIRDLRGNVPTRVNRVREGRYDAIMLARAGLVRLELDLHELWAMPLEVGDFVPAPAQGMLGIQCRRDDPWAEVLRQLHTAGAARGVAAERTLLERLDGGCQLPFGVNVQPHGDGWKLEAFLAAHAEDTGGVRFTLEGDDPAALGEEAWRRLRPHREAARR
ncbi:MAG: hydroxymethylbilane synthase [Krumholzibacteria bacterium]|nr:hydroxymethylbilane synthase [Candidatus Krumholzibacteria bacterium]